MESTEKLRFGRILLDELEKAVSELDPNSELLPEIIKKSNIIKLKMLIAYRNMDKSPEMLEQINQLESIIKKVEQMHNKHVTEM